MARLEVVGWWFRDEAPGPLPRPQLLVRPWQPAERAAVVAHLRAGKVLETYPEPSYCRFACGAADMGRADLSDGTFVWPEGLVHYVTEHSVALPARFVAHALQGAGAAPPRLPKPRFGLYDVAPWLAWARAERAALDLDGFETPLGEVRDRIARDLGPVPHEAILLCRGSTREVVLAVGGGAIELRQLQAGGRPPRRFAGWHEWPVVGAAGSGPLAAFFADRRGR
ncbi:MAG: hypothetical protein JNL08_08500 [Planctomycetes bacterium]|nr:hypothetical protein [Planctomycetota bacterium]